MAAHLRRWSVWTRSKNWSAFYDDPAKVLAAKTLHTVLLGTLPFATLCLAVVVPLFAVRKAAASATWAVLIVATLACMFLLKQGFARLSSWIFVSTAWFILAMFVALSGGIASPALLGQIAVIVGAAWLLGRRAALWIGAVSLSFGLSLAILESNGIHLPRYFPVPPMIAWVISVSLVAFAILPLTSVSQASFRRATRTMLIPEAAICRANSLPIPDEAPVTSAQGPNLFLSSATVIFSLRSACLGLVVFVVS